MDAILPLSYCWIMILALNWGLQFLDVFLGSSITSWMSCWSAVGVTLIGCPLLGRYTIVPHLSICGWWLSSSSLLESQSLRKGFVMPFQIDRCQWLLFSAVVYLDHRIICFDTISSLDSTVQTIMSTMTGYRHWTYFSTNFNHS